MPLVNLTVLSSTHSHISWTVIQVEDGLTFVTLFWSIIAGSHPRLHVDEVLSRSTLEKVFVGHSKEAMSIVDELLGVNDVCSLFGSHIKYLVRLQSLGLHDPNSPQAVPLRNAFTVLMSSSRAMKDCAKLPSTIVVRTKKDQLYNDVIAFLEKNIDGNGPQEASHMGKSLYRDCMKLSGTSMGTTKSLLIALILYPLSSKASLVTTPLSFRNTESGLTPT